MCWLSSDTHPCTYQVSLHHPSQAVLRHQPQQSARSFVRFQQSDNLSGYLLRRGIRREFEWCLAIVAGCVRPHFSPVCPIPISIVAMTLLSDLRGLLSTTESSLLSRLESGMVMPPVALAFVIVREGIVQMNNRRTTMNRVETVLQQWQQLLPVLLLFVLVLLVAVVAVLLKVLL